MKIWQGFTLGSLAVLIWVLLSTSALAIDVDCGWGNSICRENELEDEVDELEHLIEKNKWTGKENMQRINKNKNDIKKVKVKTVKLKKAVGKNSEDIVVLQNKHDNLGGRSINTLFYWMTGSGKHMKTYKTAYDFYKAMFATKDELEEVRLELDYLKAMIKLGPDKPNSEYILEGAVNTCKRLGEPQFVETFNGGYECSCGVQEIARGVTCSKVEVLEI